MRFVFYDYCPPPTWTYAGVSSVPTATRRASHPFPPSGQPSSSLTSAVCPSLPSSWLPRDQAHHYFAISLSALAPSFPGFLLHLIDAADAKEGGREGGEMVFVSFSIFEWVDRCRRSRWTGVFMEQNREAWARKKCV
jgi:hypothetical protein